MTDSLQGRLVLALVVVVAVILVLVVVRRLDARRPSRLLPTDLGPFPAALFFGDETCLACKPANAVIAEGGLMVRRFEWATHGDVFDALEVEEVPRLIVAGSRGEVLADIAGVPTPRQIAKAKLQVSPE